jgi:hypothetical protein
MSFCKTCGKKYSKWTTPVSARGVCRNCFESELNSEREAQPEEEVSAAQLAPTEKPRADDRGLDVKTHVMKTPQEIANASKAEQKNWLLCPKRKPRDILLFDRLTSEYTDIHELSQRALQVRLSEIAENQTRAIIFLTIILLILTAALAIQAIHI